MGMVPFVGPYRVDVSKIYLNYSVFAQFSGEMLGFSSIQFTAMYPTVLLAYT